MNDESGTGGGGDAHGSDIFGPLERPGSARGWLLVLVVVILGALVLPSATRAPLGASAPASSAAGTTPSTSTPATPTTTVAATPQTTRPVTTTTGPVQVPFADIHVLVANGTNTNGAAASVTSFLSSHGFATLRPTNALTTVSAAQVYAVNGADVDAVEVANALGLGSSAVEPAGMPPPVSSTAGANVIVIVGPDLLAHLQGSTGA